MGKKEADVYGGLEAVNNNIYEKKGKVKRKRHLGGHQLSVQTPKKKKTTPQKKTNKKKKKRTTEEGSGDT